MYVYVVTEYYNEYDSNWENIVGIYATEELAYRIRNGCDIDFEMDEAIAEAEANAKHSYFYSEYDKMQWCVWRHEVEE